jgi:hypothetical protein
MQKKPIYLYRYCSFDIDNRNIGIIENSLLSCPSPKRFNDPFDCRIRLNFSSMSNKQLRDYFRDMINFQIPEISKSELEKRVAYWIMNKEEAISHSLTVYENIDKYLGIFSLSARKNHLLLWAHYTSGHGGFLIEFSAQLLINFLKDKFDPINHSAYLYKVVYKNYCPKILPDKEMYKISLVKNKVWQYEKEYRIIFGEGADKSIQVSPEVINSVILGCEIKEENEAKIIDILRKKGNNIILYKAKKKNYKFGLDYIPINY